MRNHFRGAKEWDQCGMKITGASDEACKYYDAALSQVLSWGYETSMGSSSEITQKLGELSADNVLLQSLFLGIEMLGGLTIHESKELKEKVEKFSQLVEKNKKDLTAREKWHAEAIMHLSEGNIDGALLAWESILADHPLDSHAFFLSFFQQYGIGASKQMMDMANRLAPSFNRNVPLYEYMRGIQAFCCEEGGRYGMAEKIALQNIEENPHDAYSYHAMSHIYEMTRRLDVGNTFLQKYVNNWEKGPSIACHISWHNCLFHLENCRFDDAVALYDDQFKKYLTKDNFLAYTDAASLFYRLKMAGYDVGEERLKQLTDLTDSFINGAPRSFHASHLVMASLCDNDKPKAQKAIDIVKNAVPGKGLSNILTSDVGESLLDGIVQFHEGAYDDSVETLRPIRHHIYRIGGSHSQRDVYDQLICYAALNSTTPHNQHFAKQLIAERQALMGGPLTDQIASKLMAVHIANENH